MNNEFKEYFYKGKKFKIYFVPKEKLEPVFGRAYLCGKEGSYGEVRNDLNPLIKNFVIQHELYHLTDDSKWMGRLGAELRANIIPGIKNPIGFFATIFATIFSMKRLKLYFLKLTKNNG